MAVCTVQHGQMLHIYMGISGGQAKCNEDWLQLSLTV